MPERHVYKPTRGLGALGQRARVAQAVLHDHPVAVEVEVDQVVVLDDDVGAGPREAQRERPLGPAQVGSAARR